MCRSFESLHKPYAKRRRAGYYELINGRLLRNSAYRQVPEIKSPIRWSTRPRTDKAKIDVRAY